MKQQSTFKRNSKFWGIIVTKDLSELFLDYTKTLNNISSYFWHNIANGNIVKIKTHCITLKNGKTIKDTQLKNKLSNLFQTKQTEIESYKRSIVKYVMERYSGYVGRNKKLPKSPIRFHNKVMYFKDNFLSLNEKEKKLFAITLKGKIELPFAESLKSELIKKKKFGGNLKISKDKKSCYFVAAVEKEFNLIYQPQSFLAYDLNMDSDNWIFFSDEEVIKRPININEIIEEIKKINKVLNEKNLPVKQRSQNSKERKKLRLKVKKLHKELQRKLRPIANIILNKAIETKAILCIDGVNCGKKTGTFGQDHLQSMLKTNCQDHGIPYYITPTKNTTRKCSNCGYIDKNNKIDSLNFKCCECGHESLTHKNAAVNIREIGEILYREKLPFGDYKNKKIKEFEEKKETMQSFFS